MPTALAVSPHLDDAVFSCGGLLGRLADAGWSVVVTTVFTRSVASPRGFALACQLDKGLPADIDYMALRRDEDRAACACLGVEVRWLPFAEAPHRGYGSAAALFGVVHDEDAFEAEIASVLGRLVGELGPDLVLGPQAVGGHVDHVLTVRALTRLADLPTLWWRDFPYLARPSPLEPFGERLMRLPERLVPFDVARKARACAAYATQIGFQFGGLDGLGEALDGAGSVERFRSRGVAASMVPA